MNTRMLSYIVAVLIISIFGFLQMKPVKSYYVPLKNYRDTTQKQIVYTSVRQGGSSTYHRSTSSSSSYSSSSSSSRSYSGGSYSYGK